MPTKPKKDIHSRPGKVGENDPTKLFPGIPWWAPIVVILFTALIYSRATTNGFTGYDDNFYVTSNPMLADLSWTGVKAIFSSFCYFLYLPLTILVYLFEYHWFALDPAPYHTLNVILHLVNVWLVFKVVEKLSGHRLTALIVCILFAVHPMHVESVAWISELKDVLYSAFFLSSVLYYLFYVDSGFNKKHYVIALLLFQLSLLSKPAAVTLPVLLIAIDLYRGRKVNLRIILEKVPFFVLSLVFGIVMIAAVKTSGSINDSIVSYGLINKTFLVSYTLQAYIVRAVIPYNLSAMYHYPGLANGLLPWQYYTSLFFVLLMVWFLVRRSSFRKELLFGFFFFLITISIMLQVFSAGSAIIADRYTYISYIGLFYIAGQWISKTGIIKWRKVVIPVGLLLVLVYSIESWARIGVWKDSMTLFSDMIEKEPDNYFGYFMRGNTEKSDGNLQDAMNDYNTAIRLDPNFEDLYYNRGTLYDAMGNSRSAILDYNMSIKLKPQSPDAYNNRGWAYFKSNDTANALTDLSKAISLKPTYTEAYNNRGWVYYQSGNTSAALSDFNKALSINPDFNKSRLNRASLKGNTGDFEGALKDFSYLINHNTDGKASYYYRGITYLNLKDTAAACRDFKKARELGNENADNMIRQFCH